MTLKLVDFLRARLDDDERVALAAKSHTGRWHWEHGYGEMCNDSTCPFGELIDETEPEDKIGGTVLMQVHGYNIHEPWGGGEHIALHDPARALRDIKAKRTILNEYTDGGAVGGIVDGLWTALAHLAAVYADHPDYREEWKP